MKRAEKIGGVSSIQYVYQLFREAKPVIESTRSESTISFFIDGKSILRASRRNDNQ